MEPQGDLPLEAITEVACFQDICMGRKSAKLTGSICMFKQFLGLNLIEEIKKEDVLFWYLIPIDMITGLDLQIQGLTETTAYLPLNSKMTLEFSMPLSLPINQINVSSMLISLQFDLKETSHIQDIVRLIQKDRGNALRKGLPSWGPWVPSYSPWKRSVIQTALLIWTLFSVAWALWQLYQHFSLFRQLIIFSAEKIYQKFQPIWDLFFKYFGSFINMISDVVLYYLSPIHVLFVAISTPIYQGSLTLWKATAFFFQVLRIPIVTILTPIFYLLRSIWGLGIWTVKGIFSPLIEIFSWLVRPFARLWSIISTISQSMWLIIQGPFILIYNVFKSLAIFIGRFFSPIMAMLMRLARLIYSGIRVPIKIITHLISDIISKASTFEFDVHKERIDKIRRIAQNNTHAVAMGIKNLSPGMMEVKNNIVENLVDVRQVIDQQGDLFRLRRRLLSQQEENNESNKYTTKTSTQRSNKKKSFKKRQSH